ncbi:DUF1178 family protein [Cognatishimia sp. F0-27]|uniref:DUF1178 family protein n=1 Tax=Cognatishimia sp. F0-27 TaxID=2816855 RepID=UPI001D0C2C04|nr:DUF1178 family protein [Cognatishimia sp. F0-27]MCC1494888.1 DUF1178 family protein [Cognatishimia sp. F0-27]
MIQYSLKCAEGHRFDSWFQSASAFDTLLARHLVTCSVCGSAEVEKALMAPRVQAKTEEPTPPPPPESLSQQDNPQQRAIAKLRAHVEKHSDYVGKNFASEARAMYLGDAPERPIWGEARGDEAKALIDDGIPVAPLPFRPTRKAH